MSNEVRVIRVEMDAPGVKKALNDIASGFGTVNNSVKKTNEILGKFDSFKNRLIGGALFGFGVKELAGIADGIQLTQDRIKSLLGPAADTEKIFSRLAEVAENTKTGFEETGQTFARVALATKSIGLSAEGALSLTEILNRSFLLSGASAAEAAGSTRQFTQALSAGALRGEELNSILENNATLSNILKESIAGTGVSMKKFAEGGGFTTKFVLEALSKNFVKVSQDSDKLGQTFEQTVTLAFNKLKIAVGELNQELGLSKSFADFVDGILEKGPNLIAILGILALTSIPSLVKSIRTAYVTVQAFASTNPIYFAFLAISTIISVVILNIDDFGLKFQSVMASAYVRLLEIKKAFLEILPKNSPLAQSLDAANAIVRTQQQIVDARAAVAVKEKAVAEATAKRAAEEKKIADYQKQGEAFKQSIAGVKATADTPEVQLGKLNKAYQEGAIAVEKYNEKITALQTKQLTFKRDKGQITQAKYETEVAQLEFENVVRLAEKGKRSFADVEAARQNFKVKELTQQFKEGKNELREYNIEVAKLGRGFGDRLYVSLQDYVQKTGDLFQGLSGGIVQAFGHAEDAIFEFTKTGKFNFRKFASAVLDDLNRILIRTLILRAVANSISGTVGGGAGAIGNVGSQLGSAAATQTEFYPAQAKGGAWDKGVQAFAAGGVVNQPTYFNHAGGKGLMGEDGPEAILPLTRTKSGNLGVEAVGGAGMTVNIYNQSGNEVETRETTGPNGERQLEVFIMNTFKKGVDSGEMDSTFKSTYGMRRQGR